MIESEREVLIGSFIFHIGSKLRFARSRSACVYFPHTECLAHYPLQIGVKVSVVFAGQFPRPASSYSVCNNIACLPGLAGNALKSRCWGSCYRQQIGCNHSVNRVKHIRVFKAQSGVGTHLESDIGIFLSLKWLRCLAPNMQIRFV